MNFKHGYAAKRDHGLSSRLYRIWGGIVFGRKSGDQRVYGHVCVCKSWLKFENFLAWALENGYRKNLTIDRKNNSRGYCPSNCRWATMVEQARNRRSNVKITFQGETLLAIEWAERIGVHRSTVTRRIKTGWSVRDAVLRPPHRGLEP